MEHLMHAYKQGLFKRHIKERFTHIERNIINHLDQFSGQDVDSSYIDNVIRAFISAELVERFGYSETTEMSSKTVNELYCYIVNTSDFLKLYLL